MRSKFLWAALALTRSPQGPVGPQGPPGAAGAPGAQGPGGKIVTFDATATSTTPQATDQGPTEALAQATVLSHRA